ncbi:AI-2E family transporter [Paraoerskovia sediminicola]|uniref:AI-2E family transporter n=1 Tax=Paraoerskovia sediminicola TaxID=1138587 RepID=A0ABM8G3W5_9CELL|nr:AI-2E family transporter [Paraoerskovia sediminicola]BDZ42779.1 AI-2E family transporter [Paraoerskovia sediminicola]
MSIFRRRSRKAAPAGPATEDVVAPSEPVDRTLHGSDAVAPSVRTAAAWSWRGLAIGGAAAGLVWVIGAIEVIVVPIAVAILLTVLLTPVRVFFERRLRFRRSFAAGTALIGLLVLVSGLVTVAGRSIVGGFQDLAAQAQAGFNEFLDWLSTGPLNLNTDQINDYVDQGLNTVQDNQGQILSGALGAATTVGHVLTGALIALFCTFFFLLDGRTIWAWVVGLMPVRSRDAIHQAGRRGFVTLSAYTRTQILVAAVDSVGIGVGAAILGVPLAFPLAVLVFVGAFIPIVGAVLSGTVAVLVALVANDWVTALIMLAIVLVVQQIEGHVLQPFLMGHALSLHPVAVLLAVAAGAFTAGIVGALFAVPVVAVVNTVVLYFHGHDKFPELGTEDRVMVRGRPALPNLPEVPTAVRRAEMGLLVSSAAGIPWQPPEGGYTQRAGEWRERSADVLRERFRRDGGTDGDDESGGAGGAGGGAAERPGGPVAR